MRSSIHFYFRALTISIGLALILPTLMQDGMFMDGLLYASVAKNLADGHGSLWFPHFSKVLYPFFNQQPPMGFWILSLFYKLFGASIYVERFYTLLMAVLTALAIQSVWKEVSRESKIKSEFDWLPVFFWITIPVCFWAYSNGVLENTMAVFDLFAVYFALVYIRKRNLMLLVLSGFFIICAMMTKGIQGSFPLIIFLLYWIAIDRKNFLIHLRSSLILLLIPALFFFILYQFDEPRRSLSEYLSIRVLNSIENVASVESRFYLLGRLAMELLPGTIIAAAIVWLVKTPGKNSEGSSYILLFILIGICASFPLMVTLEQRGFYLVTSLPYFAIALALWALPKLIALFSSKNYLKHPSRSLRIISWMALAGVLVFSGMQTGKAVRDETTLHDIYLIGEQVPESTILGAKQELWEQWSFQEYLIRHFYVHLDRRMGNDFNYLILEEGHSLPDSLNFQKVDIPTIKYHLYKKN